MREAERKGRERKKRLTERMTMKREGTIALQVGQCQEIVLSDVDGERTHRASSKLRKEAAERNLSILARPSKCFHKDL